jgi:hypothetical protein
MSPEIEQHIAEIVELLRLLVKIVGGGVAGLVVMFMWMIRSKRPL